ncbi:MAG: CarD family transcriptional regulator [Anaerolineae bacterium]
MAFSVGDRVVHPKHGAGQITDIEHQELVEGFDRYYVIKIPDQNTIVCVPVSQIDKLGVRPVMSPSKVPQVLDVLRSRPRRLSTNPKKREDQIRNKLKASQPSQVAEAVRDLTWHRQQAHLTKIDADLLDWGRGLLASEMALVTGIDIAEAHQTIEAALRIAMAKEPDSKEAE